MSCTELGFDEYGNLRVSKTVDSEETFVFPSTYDFTGYSGKFQIRASESAASALLSVTTTPTASGSVITFDGSNIVLLLKASTDLSSLPDAADADDPYVGVYEFTITDPDGLVSRLCAGSLTAEKGVAR